jgi:hypothetical protein
MACAALAMLPTSASRRSRGLRADLCEGLESKTAVTLFQVKELLVILSACTLSGTVFIFWDLSCPAAIPRIHWTGRRRGGRATCITNHSIRSDFVVLFCSLYPFDRGEMSLLESPFHIWHLVT